MLRLLLEYGADLTGQGALPRAAFFGYLEVVRLLLNYGAAIDEADQYTALYRASSFGYTEIVEVLLREGADTGVLAPSGESALWKSVQGGHYECTRLLLSYGARPNVGLGVNGETALYQACALGHEPTVRLLLRSGARPNSRPHQYNGPARSTGSLPLDQLGTEAGRPQSSWGSDEPLHVAARGGRFNIARLLLNYGASVNAKNRAGQSALDIASERRHPELIKLLLENGGQGNERNAALLGANDEYKRGRADNPRYKTNMLGPRRNTASTAEVDGRLQKVGGSQVARPPLAGDTLRRSKSSYGYRREDVPSRQKKSSVKGGGLATAGAAVALLFDNFDAFLI